MEKKYQFFISSPYEDLKEERALVQEAILEKGHIPRGMEFFLPSGKTQWELIKDIINESDYFILLLAGKYGSVNWQRCIL